jgi:hypothetical protein
MTDWAYKNTLIHTLNDLMDCEYIVASSKMGTGTIYFNTDIFISDFALPSIDLVVSKSTRSREGMNLFFKNVFLIGW